VVPAWLAVAQSESVELAEALVLPAEPESEIVWAMRAGSALSQAGKQIPAVELLQVELVVESLEVWLVEALVEDFPPELKS